MVRMRSAKHRVSYSVQFFAAINIFFNNFLQKFFNLFEGTFSSHEQGRVRKYLFRESGSSPVTVVLKLHCIGTLVNARCGVLLSILTFRVFVQCKSCRKLY